METGLYHAYVDILKEELIPAMGCTEPIAVAYAAAIAAKTLGTLPEDVDICVSGNIIKNVKSVIVPNTGGLKGLNAAAAAGIAAGDPDRELQVISKPSRRSRPRRSQNSWIPRSFTVRRSESGLVFDIEITVSAGGHWASCRIAGFHTNVISIKKDGAVLLEKEYCEAGGERKTDRSLLTVEKIVEFADALDARGRERDPWPPDRIQHGHRRGRNEGQLRREYRQDPGRGLRQQRVGAGQGHGRRGLRRRMNGCELPVVINSGSGNQGITASVPVIVYARELGVSEDMLLRALAVSNLVTIHLKTGIGSLSAYCGSTSAGCGAGAGITYLYGGRYNEIAHTIVNAVAINSGMICDGAKASCAAKIASAVEAGLLGMQMYMHGNEFYGGDGIVTKGVENTINNVGKLARDGMSQTDKEIINIMIEK
jgi:L-cysteine desulfidase